MSDHPDLFAPRPVVTQPPVALGEYSPERKHARECYFRFIGRYPMTREEREDMKRRHMNRTQGDEQ